MPASVTSSWWTTSTGASASVVSTLSVTTMATSMMRSVSGLRPVISMSIQIRLLAFWDTVSGVKYGVAGDDRHFLILSATVLEIDDSFPVHGLVPRCACGFGSSAALARGEAEALRAGAPRCGPGSFRRSDQPRGTSEGGRLHGGAWASRGGGDHPRYDRAPRAHARREPRLDRGALRDATLRVTVPRCGAGRHRGPDRGRALSAACVVSHFRARAALRIQPHDARALGCRHY